MDIIESLPPVIRILLNEDLTVLHNRRQARPFLQRLIPELRQQTEWTLANSSSIYDDPISALPGFLVWATRSMDPFSHRGKCSLEECRINGARSFARSLGLYADTIVLHDVFTSCLSVTPQMNDDQLFDFVNDALVLKTLEPLIKAGAIRFQLGRIPLCKHCYGEFRKQVETVSSELTAAFASEISVRRSKDFIFVSTGKLYDPPIDLALKVSGELEKDITTGKSIKEIARAEFEHIVHDAVNAALLDMCYAEHSHATLFSSSRLDLLSIRAIEKTAPSLNEIDAWESARSVKLPWIGDLSVSQVVELRERASKALPAFRKTMRRACAPGFNKEKHVAKIISQLRAESAETADELRSVNRPAKKLFRGLLGALGLTISMYGLAAAYTSAAAAVSSLGGLTALLSLLHTSHHQTGRQLDRLKSRPAYVLLKAQEIAKQNHASHC